MQKTLAQIFWIGSKELFFGIYSVGRVGVGGGGGVGDLVRRVELILDKAGFVI